MKKSYLAFAISAALATSAYAADDNTKNEKDVEVIEVTGIRSSLKEAQEIKKLSTNVVDALVAEDIGKFPDSNVAEAMQRIPGVSVSRIHGEGQAVTVRGLSGDYNVTTLNGRKIASEAVNRDFNYDLIASELIAGIQVNKTQQAKLPEGGIGAIINIDTLKPLNVGDMIAGSVEAYQNERQGDVSPQASFMISKTFADEEFGALFSMTHTERKTRFDSHSAQWGWGEWKVGDLQAEHATPDAKIRFPNWPNIMVSTDERKRTGATLGLQWQPTANLDINFDALYTNYEIVSTGNMISYALFEGTNRDNIQEVILADDGHSNSITIGEPGNPDAPAIVELLQNQQPRESDTFQVGFNVNYIWDRFNFNFDIAYSEAEDSSHEVGWIVIRSVVDSLTMNWDNGALAPDIMMYNVDGSEAMLDQNYAGVDGTGGFGGWYARIDGDSVKDKTGNFNFDGTYEPDEGIVSTVNFGAGYNMQDKGKTFWNQKNPSAYTNDDMSIINAPDSAKHNFAGNTLWGPLPDTALLPGGFDSFMGNSGANLPNTWSGISTSGLFDYYRSLDNDAFEQYMTQRPSLVGGNTYGVKEETIHLYAEVLLEDQILGMPLTIDLGLRYIQTDIESWGYSQNPANIAFNADGTITDAHEETGYVEFSGSYSKLLPSFNGKIAVTDDVVLRLSLSQAMSRPPLTNLSPVTSISQNETTLRNFIYENDPGLEPYYADQLDTAIEWYYSKDGNLNFATFYKELHGFVDYEPTNETIAGKPFEVTRPLNADGKTSRIRGYEVNWLQNFDAFLPESLAGFGISANYTYNNSESGEYSSDGDQLPFTGLSENQYNIVAFYEQHGFMVNIAYNYRSEYSLGTQWSPIMPSWDGGFDETLEVDEWGALDLSMSYEINDNIIVTFDASNLLDPDYVQYLNGDTEFVDYVSSWGRSYTAGVRFKF
ncbi:TonB-dependent receptor [Paraglaciecola sp.]|uniref:TonB-dependent receptor n=1 Tax=Paraglaciecola sp. TaxID=1920173 RepID=UPI0030F42125